LSHGSHVTKIYTTQFLLQTQHPKSVLQRGSLLVNTWCFFFGITRNTEGHNLCCQNAKILILQQVGITVLYRLNTAAIGLKNFGVLIFIRVKGTSGI
jgi:hypothetical protein